MRILPELREFIRTPENSPYKGHFLVSYKRSGNICLYKHRHYEDRTKVYGYYLFELQEGNDSDNLPNDFKYYKSLIAARRKYKALTGGETEIKGISTIPQYFEEQINNKKFTQLKRIGNTCLYEVRYIRSGRVYEYHVFNIKLDKKGNERYPYFYHANINIIQSLNRAQVKFDIMVREIECYRAEREAEQAQIQLQMARIQEARESALKAQKEMAEIKAKSLKSTIKKVPKKS